MWGCAGVCGGVWGAGRACVRSGSPCPSLHQHMCLRRSPLLPMASASVRACFLGALSLQPFLSWRRSCSCPDATRPQVGKHGRGSGGGGRRPRPIRARAGYGSRQHGGYDPLAVLHVQAAPTRQGGLPDLVPAAGQIQRAGHKVPLCGSTRKRLGLFAAEHPTVVSVVKYCAPAGARSATTPARGSTG